MSSEKAKQEQLDLPGLGLVPGAGVVLETELAFDPFRFGGETYVVLNQPVSARVEVSRMSGTAYALKLDFVAELSGPCMRCLQPASLARAVSTREVCDPKGAEHLESTYLIGSDFQLSAWARDSLALELPTQVVCRDGCLGLCPECGINLNDVGSDHSHGPHHDPRWDALKGLKL